MRVVDGFYHRTKGTTSCPVFPRVAIPVGMNFETCVALRQVVAEEQTKKQTHTLLQVDTI